MSTTETTGTAQATATTEQRGEATIIRGLTDDAYRALPGLNQSALKDFIDDPAGYHLRATGAIPPPEPNDGMRFGTAFEAFLFEQREPGILIPPEVLNAQGHRKGAAWTQWEAEARAQHGPTSQFLKADEYQALMYPLLLARDNIEQHAKARELIRGERKIVLQWQDDQTGLECKCQLDNVCTEYGLLVDLKTARENKPAEFNRSVQNYGYHIQAWWYREAWRKATGERWPFVFVVVKNNPGYSTEVIDLDDTYLTLAEYEVRSALDRYRHALATGRWVSPTHGTITTITPAKWAWNALDE